MNDSTYIASRLPWWGALLFGAVSFFVLYFVVPEWLETRLHAREVSAMYPVLENIIGRRLHWFKWVGIASGIVFCIFAVRNFFLTTNAKSRERRIMSIVARLIGRSIE